MTQLGHSFYEGHRQPLGDHPDHPRLHRLGHMTVAGADHGALALATAARDDTVVTGN